MDHWGTPLYISRKELQTDPILIHCFLPDSVDDVIETLEEQSDILIKWLTENHMQANPDKFQAISIGRKTHEKNLSFL
jgi:hypothetical protein